MHHPDPAPRPHHPVRVLRHVWIPMRDGVRLAARVWLPEDVTEPQPAILEYIPYRKNDGTASRDVTLHGAFARAGYAALRVDCRGSGDSEGVMLDEYHQDELDDAVDILAWLEQQEWCDGNVAMIGKSWGGFNGLQVAAMNPPQLKAVVTVCSTDDRYHDDVHYQGGAVLASEMLPWAATMLCYNARPQDPEVYGDAWREEWFARMARTPSYLDTWLGHQRRDAYWRHGSVIENPEAITAAVLTVGGWADPYRGAVRRLLGELTSPAKGLIGPWAHTYPHQAEPGPAMDFIGECLRWFGRYLRGEDTGADRLPALRAWMPDPAPFGSDSEERPGRWVVEEELPSPHIHAREFALRGTAALPPEQAGAPGAQPAAQLRSPLAVGAAAGNVLQFGDLAGRPGDQSADDGRSHTFTSAPLTERLEILGEPEVELTVSADRPRAQLAVRLCEVTPDGASRLVTTGLLNLTHRDSHAEPQPLEPGRQYRVTVPLFLTGHAFAAGSRVRVSVSASYWPWMWPSPEPVTVTVLPEGGTLRLPERPADPARDGEPTALPTPDPPAALDVTEVPATRTVRWDPVAREQVVEMTFSDGTTVDLTDGLTRTETELNRFRIREDDPASPVVECERTDAISRGSWDTEVRTYSRMTSTVDDFHVTNRLVALEGGREVFTRSWETTIPRDEV
ncbi:CocE/NonD family hydrolase [Streptomyces cacaoi]|uniref:CocE/NonD family hydrolase n=2 Tax=Streptomyces cacaoi TaxID=1898 RepID=UPI0011F18D69|nr:CocE/NonD family hydrolase [Streptomyces cacaoi]